jgi:hypothetical protein
MKEREYQRQHQHNIREMRQNKEKGKSTKMSRIRKDTNTNLARREKKDASK